jgi:hypothetical protein
LRKNGRCPFVTGKKRSIDSRLSLKVASLFDFQPLTQNYLQTQQLTNTEVERSTLLKIS